MPPWLVLQPANSPGLERINRKVENRTGNRLTEPVFKTARKPKTNHKPNRTEPNRNRTVPRFAGAASVKATNQHYWPLLVLLFASAVLATHETPLKFGMQKKAAHERSVTCVFFALLSFDRRQHRQQHRHGIPFQSGKLIGERLSKGFRNRTEPTLTVATLY